MRLLRTCSVLVCGLLSLSATVSAIHVSSNAVLDARMDLVASTDVDADTAADAAQRTAIATQLDRELFQHLSSLSSNSELVAEVGAQFLDKRVGIEIEFQDNPRMVIAVIPTKIAEFKDQFEKVGGTFYNTPYRNKWLIASSAPLQYGFEWLQSDKDNDVPYWFMNVDNERVDLDADSVNFWAPHLVAMGDEPSLDAAKNALTGDCGRNAAMELVTYPLLTTNKFDTTPNLIYINQMARILTSTLRKFMLPVAQGGVVDATMLASHANFGVLGRQVFEYALKNDYGDPATLVIVKLAKIMQQFEADVDAHFGVGKWPNIKDYKFKKRYLDSFLFNTPFVINKQQRYYDRFLTFRLLNNANLVDTPQKLSNVLGLGPQLNFGFPVANFGYPPTQYMNKIQKLDKRHPTSGYIPFTTHIWAQVHKYGNNLFTNAKTMYNNQYKKQTAALTKKDIADARGFACIAVHIYFITIYLGQTEKFAQSVLLKSSLNDILRLLSYKVKKVWATWWDTHGSAAAFKQFDQAAKMIWVNANLNLLRGGSYASLKPTNYDTVGDISRKNAAYEFLKQVFWAVTTDANSRWANEKDGEFENGKVKYPTIYGTLKVTKKQYPPGRDDILPIAKGIDPFTIKDIDNIRRPAVLLEHRDADHISDLWSDFTQPPLPKPSDMVAALQPRIDEMTTIQEPNSLLERLSMAIKRAKNRVHEWYDTDEPKPYTKLNTKRAKSIYRPLKTTIHQYGPAEISNINDNGNPFDDTSVQQIVTERSSKLTQAIQARCKHLTEMKKNKPQEFATLSADQQADLEDC